MQAPTDTVAARNGCPFRPAKMAIAAAKREILFQCPVVFFKGPP
jgi:hypothetical protein